MADSLKAKVIKMLKPVKELDATLVDYPTKGSYLPSVHLCSKAFPDISKYEVGDTLMLEVKMTRKSSEDREGSTFFSGDFDVIRAGGN